MSLTNTKIILFYVCLLCQYFYTMSHYFYEEVISFDSFTFINLESRIDLDSIHKANIEGWTQLMYACSNGNRDLVNHLISLGCSISPIEQSNKTPLMLAVTSGDLDLVQSVCVLEDLEVKDNRGWTALFYAVYYGQGHCVQYLMQIGANGNAKDKFGQTPLLLARNNEMENITQILLEGTKYQNNCPLSPIVCKTEDQKEDIRSPNSQITSIKRRKNIFKYLRTYSPNLQSSPADKENRTPRKNEFSLLKSNAVERAKLTPNKKIEFVKLTPSKRSANIKEEFITRVPAYVNLPVRSPTTPTLAPSKNFIQPNVLTFLMDLGLERYWTIFKDEEVDLETLMTFNEENLVDIGIKLYGPRRKILLAIEEYRSVHGSGSRLLKSSIWLK